MTGTWIGTEEQQSTQTLLVIITDSAEMGLKDSTWSCHIQDDKHFNFWWHHYQFRM